MKKFFQENIKTFGLLGVITLIYFVIRLPHLIYQPIFADEAIYIRWAQIMRAEPTLRFVSLSDGKTPLFMWLMIPLFKVVEDPLLAGRFLSVLSGYLTVLGVLFVGWLVFNKRVGLWSAFLVTITPFFVFFDRMALVDSLLCALSVWSIGIALLLVKFPRWDLAMVLGYLMGGALLTKTPAFFTVVMMPFSILIFNFKTNKRQQRIVRMFLLWLVAIVITIGVYNILRLGPGFSNLNSRNQDYVLSPTILLTRPWDPFIPHLGDLTDFFPKLLGYVVLFLIVWAGILVLVRRKIALLTIFLFGLIPLVIEMALLRTFTARYILFSMPYLVLTAGFALDDITNRLKKRFNLTWIRLVMVWFILLWPAYFIYYLHFDIAKTPLPRIERQGYLSEWTAGYGLKEIAQFLDNESKKRPVVVGTQGSFGTLPEGLQIYLDKSFQVAIVPGGSTISAAIKQTAKNHPTFYVGNKDGRGISDRTLELIKEYSKIAGVDGSVGSVQLFKVNYLPESESTESAVMKGEFSN